MLEAVMKQSVVLVVDAVINVVLGVLLIVFPRPLADALGLPTSQSAFYPSILGGVLLGIGIAMTIQITRSERADGLGLRGAVAINLCGGFVLAAWLTLGVLELPIRGRVFLWSLVAVLMGISFLELLFRRERKMR
jgi:hypothetical protein